jgi:hypothetical protein
METREAALEASDRRRWGGTCDGGRKGIFFMESRDGSQSPLPSTRRASVGFPLCVISARWMVRIGRLSARVLYGDPQDAVSCDFGA